MCLNWNIPKDGFKWSIFCEYWKNVAQVYYQKNSKELNVQNECKARIIFKIYNDYDHNIYKNKTTYPFPDGVHCDMHSSSVSESKSVSSETFLTKF